MNAKLKWSIVICITVAIGVIVWLSTRFDDTLKQQILEMQGQHINLNFKHARCIFNGTDSLFVNNSKPKLIVYVDSTSCSSCFMGQLINYYEVNDSLNSHKGELIIVLHPQESKIPQLETRLSHERFPFWCIMDVEGEFIKLNHTIPNNPLLHTFTVDENNDVVLIGDPTKNEKIQDLFFQQIQKEGIRLK